MADFIYDLSWIEKNSRMVGGCRWKLPRGRHVIMPAHELRGTHVFKEVWRKCRSKVATTTRMPFCKRVRVQLFSDCPNSNVRLFAGRFWWDRNGKQLTSGQVMLLWRGENIILQIDSFWCYIVRWILIDIDDVNKKYKQYLIAGIEQY